MHITKNRKEAESVLEEMRDSMSNPTIVENVYGNLFAVCESTEEADAQNEMNNNYEDFFPEE
jgi:hypothetical protein